MSADCGWCEKEGRTASRDLDDEVGLAYDNWDRINSITVPDALVGKNSMFHLASNLETLAWRDDTDTSGRWP